MASAPERLAFAELPYVVAVVSFAAVYGVVMPMLRKAYRLSLYVLFFTFSLLASSVLVSELSYGSTVKVCETVKRQRDMNNEERQKKQKKARKVYCSIKPQMGDLGDYVEIKNQYNYIVAVGRIVKQKRHSTIVVLTKYNPKEGSMRGYPVMLRKNESQDFWTATTAPF